MTPIPSAVLATHLSELIRTHGDELLSRQDVKDMCESIREFAPSLVEDLVPDKVPINMLHNVLRAMLHERIPVRDIVTVLETLANYMTTDISSGVLPEGFPFPETLHRNWTSTPGCNDGCAGSNITTALCSATVISLGMTEPPSRLTW